MNRTEKKFLETVRVHRLAVSDDSILVAVSGGADSMALLHLFLVAMPVLQCRKVGVVHCNFGLRGEESDGDEAFVREVCRELGIACHVRRFDTRAVSGEWKKSIEETARHLRYAFFEELLEREGYCRLATGHHGDDNAETMLFNLFRGSSVSAMQGIRRVRGSIVRPLLSFRRQELLMYLAEKGITSRTDSSNLGSAHDRNFIRNRVVPLIEERFRNKLVPSLQRLSEHASELDEFLEHHFDTLLATRQGLYPEAGKLRIAELLKLTLFEQKEIMKRALREYGATVDSRVLVRLAGLLSQQQGRSVPVGNGLRVIRKDGYLRFVPVEAEPDDKEGESPVED